MQRMRLVDDYIFRAQKRIKALEFLKSEESYADVVREAQEVVELLLKALIIAFGIEVPKVHDVSRYIEMNKEVFPQVVNDNLERLKDISRRLRKERELSFYGMEDWIPSEEYSTEEAQQAIDWAKEIEMIVKKALGVEL
ncbi:HEPN domain-containing protein [Deferribacterales bacterium Es71-Z0220]|uniref:HEPN domain-containing protein n=1 Tax=Deferrivibrio essentukiensis TaxID=2880922 RepID=UPI001F60528D|nr:HEPN domain-containing protein [Deferrivibrio essentukiensis]MCB4205361.1 HEPN domain-containing protein [Deferrivibrio essentukiensis]